jgi:hypothetical protein
VESLRITATAHSPWTRCISTAQSPSAPYILNMVVTGDCAWRTSCRNAETRWPLSRSSGLHVKSLPRAESRTASCSAHAVSKIRASRRRLPSLRGGQPSVEVFHSGLDWAQGLSLFAGAVRLTFGVPTGRSTSRVAGGDTAILMRLFGAAFRLSCEARLCLNQGQPRQLRRKTGSNIAFKGWPA